MAEKRPAAQPPAQPSPASQPHADTPQIAVLGFNSFQKGSILWVRKWGAPSIPATISARFSETILKRIASRNVNCRGQKMIRNRTRGDHFGSLFGYHSERIVSRNETFRDPNMLRDRTRGDHFGRFSDPILERITSRNDCFQETRNSALGVSFLSLAKGASGPLKCGALVHENY